MLTFTYLYQVAILITLICIEVSPFYKSAHSLQLYGQLQRNEVGSNLHP